MSSLCRQSTRPRRNCSGMVEQKWERNGRRILDLETGDAELYDTFNGAKRKSRALQMKNTKALGRGDMRLKRRRWR